MASNIGLVGVLIATIGAGLILYGLVAMKRAVNSARPPETRFKGSAFLPPASGQIVRAYRIEHPGKFAGKALAIGVGLMMAGIAIMTATNAYHADHPS